MRLRVACALFMPAFPTAMEWEGEISACHPMGLSFGSPDPTEPRFLSGLPLNPVSHTPPGCPGTMSPSAVSAAVP